MHLFEMPYEILMYKVSYFRIAINTYIT